MIDRIPVASYRKTQSDDDGHRSGEDDRAGVERDQVGDAEHRSGKDVVDERDEFERRAGRSAAPAEERDAEGQDRAGNRGRDRDEQRVRDGIEPRREDEPVVVEREAVVHAPDLHEGTDEDRRVEREDEQRHDRDRAEDRGAGASRGLRVSAPRPGEALARHCHVAAAVHPETLREEDRERGQQQDERDDGAAPEVVHPGDLEIDLRRQHGKRLSRHHERRGEVRERFREEQQEGVREARDAQRQRDGPEDAPLRRPQAARRVLAARVDRPEDGRERQKREREVGQRFGEQRSRKAVDREVRQMQQPLQQSARSENERQRDASRKRRRDERQNRDGREKSPDALRHVDARDGEREKEAQERPAQAHGRREQQAVAERPARVGVREDAREIGDARSVRLSVGGNEHEQQPRERIENKQRQQQPDRRTRGDPGCC